MGTKYTYEELFELFYNGESFDYQGGTARVMNVKTYSGYNNRGKPAVFSDFVITVTKILKVESKQSKKKKA